MKKILYVTTIAGFLPQFEMSDVEIAQSMGYEVHYASNFLNPVYSFDQKELEKKNVRLHQIDIAQSPYKLRSNFKAIRQLKKILEKENIALIHCHNPMGAVAARLAAQHSKTKPKVMYTAHGFHFYQGAPILNWLLFYPVEKYLARYTDAIITINREDYELARKRFTLRESGFVTQIHGVGVDMEKFRPRPEIAEAKKAELGIPQGAFHIVTAGQLNENKNQQVLIRALEQLKDPEIYLSICGLGYNEEMLRTLSKECGLQKNVHLLGFRTDMSEILQTADMFAFPSRREGLGIAAVEALSCGIPVVAGNNRGTREYIREDKNGYLVGANDVAAFSSCIAELKRNPLKRERLAAFCRESAERFGTAENRRMMEIVYKQMDAKVRDRNA